MVVFEPSVIESPNATTDAPPGSVTSTSVRKGQDAIVFWVGSVAAPVKLPACDT